MEVASSIGGKVIELTVEPIGRQFGYVIFYQRNVMKLRDAFQELQHHRDDVRTKVDAARRQGEEILKVVEGWFTSVDKTTEEARALYERERNENTDCSWSSCPNLWLRHQISRKAKKLTIEIQKHKNDGKFERVSYSILPELVGVPPTCEENDERIESRISIRNQVLEALRGSSSSRVGLCGLPGVGKTTLAKEIANIANEQKEIFGLVVWVTVAHNSKIESLQEQIAENVGMKLGVQTVNARAKHLHQRLENENNVLVVLDDLWERLDLSLVGIPPNCRILFTSRNEELLSTHMNCQNIFMVGELSEEEAWKLFKDNAKFDESNHTELLPLAKEVCQRCGRLPLALVSVARALKNKREVRDWRNARRRLEMSLGKYLQAWNKEIGPSLKLSYDNLNSELQSIFLLSALLSHDPLIKDILWHAVGLGLLEGVQSMNDAHDTLDGDIRDLKASSLLLDSYSDDRVTMHDLFRDFAFEVQESSVVRLKGGQGDLKDMMTQLKGCTTRLVLDKWDETLPDELPCPKLEFFFLNGEGSDLKIPDNFFKSLNELRAMQFTGVNLSSLSTLGHLQNLRTLCLESCAIFSDISQVGNLKNLKVLSFAGSEIKQLPHTLSHLTCLQVLDLSSCERLKVIPPKVLSSLTNLEVLNMRNSFCQWEAEGSTKENRNASLDELKHLTKLYDLNIHITQNLVLPKDLFNGMRLERYMISYGKSVWWENGGKCSRRLGMRTLDLDDEMQNLLEKVQNLYLCDVKVKTDVLGGTLLLPLQCVGLEHLEVEECKSINAIVGSIDKDSTDVILFHALRTLWMRNMPKLSAFYEQKKINAKSNSLFNSKISFPKIEKLELRVLNRMISSIWDDQLPENSFTNLTTLKVVHCGFMGRLVPFHVLKSLKHLEKVVVNYCDKVEVVFDFEELNSEEIQSPALINVPLKNLSLYKLPRLKHVCSSLAQETVSFPCLEEVEIYECERLTSMFPSSQLQEEYPLFPHQKVVQNMKRLTCDGKFAKMLWDGQFPNNYFSNLEYLSLYLDDESVNTTFPRGLYLSKFPNLQTLVLKGYMKELISSSCPVPPLDNEVGAPFTTLAFHEMYSFEHIWNENTQSMFLLQNPQTLRVSACHNLINMGTSFISFTNLTEIKVSTCHKMISLLTSSASKGLVHLTKLTISHCNQMKEVVAEQQLLEKDDDDLSGRETIVSQKLEYLRLDFLRSLRSFCNYNYSFKFPSLKEVIITDCPGMIMFCQGDVHTPHLKGVTFENGETRWEGSLNKTIQYFWVSEVKCLKLGPQMRSLWMEQYPQRSMGFSRLEEITIDQCDFLCECAIPTHLVRSLSITLKRLVVCNCQYIKAIFGPIMDDEGEAHLDDGSQCFRSLRKLDISECQSLEYIFMASSVAKELEDKSLEESPDFVFPHLESLRLEKLHDLKGFCPQRCTFECPQLIELRASQCENFKVFGTKMTCITHSSGKESKDESEESQTMLFLAEKVIPNLSKLSLSEKDVALIKNHQFEMNLFDKVEDLTLGESAAAASFPFDFLGRFPKLLKLRVEHSDFEEMFSSQPQQRAFSSSLEELRLSCLDQLNTIWNDDDDDDDDSQSQPLHLTSLEVLVVECCPKLIKLIPSSASLGNLIHLEVSGCHQLTYLFTDSTAKSLVNLSSLTVTDCKKMEEIVRNKSEEDAVVGVGGGGAGITFNGLRELVLTGLPSLKGFCLKNLTFEFPILLRLTLEGCHEMKMFSLGVSETPDLSDVKIDDIEMGWKGDINKTIELFISKKMLQVSQDD